MPTVERVIGMHNENSESNTDKVWAGVIVALDDGTSQFIALNGRRQGFIRPSPQPSSRNPAVTFRKFEQMRREKLSHGYHVIDWTEARFGLLSAIGQLGEVTERLIRRDAVGDPTVAATLRQAMREPVTRPERPSRDETATLIEIATATAPGAPSVDQLIEYIANRTGTQPEPEPEPEKKPEAPQPPIRKARRLDF